jgi:transposase
LVKRIEELDIEPHKLHFGGSGGSYISPEEQQKIREAYYPDAQPAPEGYTTVSQVARQTGVSRNTILRLISKNDIEIEPVAIRGNRPNEGLSPEAQVALASLLKERAAEPAPEGYTSVNNFLKQSHMSRTTLNKMIEEHGIEVGRHRFQNHTVASISPEAQEQVLEIQAKARPLAPEGYVSVTAFADSVGADYDTIRKLVTEHGIKTEQHVFGRMRMGASLSPEAQQQIRELRGN